MNRRWWLLPMALAVMASAPIASADFETRFKSAATLYDTNRAAEALPILDAMLTENIVPAEKGRIQLLRFFVLARLERIPEARAAIEIAIANTEAPAPAALAALFKIRALMGDNAAAADSLLLIANSDPPTLNGLPTDMIAGVRRAIDADAARSFDLDYALNAANWSPPDTTLGDADNLRLRLVAGLVARDRIEDARAIVDQLLNPVALVRVGIDRRFVLLWPQVEKRLGPGSDTADAAFVAAARARFERQPKSLIARLGLAEALNIASREPEALALASVAPTAAELAALADREVWLIALQAALLADAGQIDAALARYTALTATPVANRSSIIAAMVNHPLLAVRFNRPAAALAAVDFADRATPGISAFGRAKLIEARTCALQQSGRKAEALTAAAPLLAAAPEKSDPISEDARLSALLCLEKIDAAAKIVIRHLGDPETRSDMLFDLQPFLIADRAGQQDNAARARLRTLKARPDVKTAFMKAGRDLPAAVSPPR